MDDCLFLVGIEKFLDRFGCAMLSVGCGLVKPGWIVDDRLGTDLILAWFVVYDDRLMEWMTVCF